MSTKDAEAERIRAEYERRERDIGRDFYALTRPSNLFIRHGQERALLRGLEQADALPLTDKRILEVGCGRGQWIGVFEDFGARREHFSGIDLDPERLADARQRFAGADLRAGDATKLPWNDGEFDIVFQSTMFTSILDASVKHAAAAEMQRVLAPNGLIVWYDFRFDNPSNKSVRGIDERELKSLFAGCSISVDRVTLAPPIARRVVPMSWLLSTMLERLRVLNTHLLAVVRR